MLELNNQMRGILSVVGGFLVHIVLGTFYTLGNINTYLTSYLRANVDKDLTYASTIWLNAAFMLGQGALMMAGGILENRIGPRLTCLLGSLIFSIAIGFTYYTVQYGFLAVVLTYGFISSLGVGFAYVAPLAAGMKWFPKQKGFVNGVIVCGYGLGALIFTHIQTAYLNPNNLSPDADGYFHDKAILERVPSMFVLLFGLYLTIQLLGCCLIFTPPKRPNEYIYGEGQLLLRQAGDDDDDVDGGGGVGAGVGGGATAAASDEEINGGSIETNVVSQYSCDEQKETVQIRTKGRQTDLSYKEALYTREFVLLWLMFALSTQSVQFINTMYKAYGQRFISDDLFLATVGSVASIFNATGRLFWGHLVDRTSFRLCINLICGLTSFLMLTFELSLYYQSRTLFFIWVTLIFFTFSGNFVVFPTATAQVFGRTDGGTIYGFLFTAPALVSLCGAFLIQIVLQTLGWFGSFFMISVFSAGVIVLMQKFPKDVDHLLVKKNRH